MLLFFGPLGGQEILLIILLALLLFGPKKIPEIARSLGRGFREFKQTTSGLMDSINNEVKDIGETTTPPPKASQPVAPPRLARVQPPPAAPLDAIAPTVLNLEDDDKDQVDVKPS